MLAVETALPRVPRVLVLLVEVVTQCRWLDGWFKLIEAAQLV